MTKMNIVLLLCYVLYCSAQTEKKQKLYSLDLELIEGKDDGLLLFSTLDGTLVSLDKKTGKTKWKIKEKPIVQVPSNVSNAIIPIFLPDPRDGSLYLIGDAKEPLKKLPFTIPQLVSSSPCRSSDGILYTGMMKRLKISIFSYVQCVIKERKKDAWFKLDLTNGRKQQILGWDDHSPTCPVDSESSIYIGRTEYTLRMVEEKKPENKWNVTFYEFTARTIEKDEYSKYDFLDMFIAASSSTGMILSINKNTGNLLWQKDLESPLIAVYFLDSEGLLSIPFSSLGNDTLTRIKNNYETNGGEFDKTKFVDIYPTLYIGEHTHGLFALPSYVDKNYVNMIGSDNGLLLLSGPQTSDNVIHSEYPLPGHNYYHPKGVISNSQVLFQSLSIFKGHYDLPNYSERKLLPGSNNLIDFKGAADKDEAKVNGEPAKINVLTIDDSGDGSKDQNYWLKVQYRSLKMWINQQENKALKISLIVMTGCVIAMFWYLQIQVREFQSQSRNSSQSNQQNSGQTSVTALPEEMPDGLVRIGKITFHPEQLLGKGCEGTFVYRGEFDNRRVAVKRLLPECFTFADREVALLRESDAHPNVIRYYCMEQDRMFRYIALELCQATLCEYIQGTCDICPITPLEILKEATSGLCHLHSLDIVHRDIKPQNVLISVPDNRRQVRVMISDFGLCKKLQVGKMSFSRRSGVTGTDGWIAPEMLNSTERTTYAVDMFSLGCLYYYVLSKGSHPFGDSLRRQANILSGKYDLCDLKGPDWMSNVQIALISALISPQPEERPPCKAVLNHPMFWDYDNILNFFQEVSDRIEKSSMDDFILVKLENDSTNIVRGDWRVHIHDEVASDLKKYRSYQGESVRDLLRALRNKKHHFRELSIEAQTVLGTDSESFAGYWLNRFPLLLVYTWMVMQCAADEEHFRKFYQTCYRYSWPIFREQMLDYVSKNPSILPEDYFEKAQVGEGGDNIKTKYKKYVNSSPKKKLDSNVSSGLVKSGGLYRNHGDDRAKFGNKKKKLKKSDEPLVWTIGNS